MKRYLTAIFLVISALILIIGLQFDLQWSGIVTWGLTSISLVFAAYYTKYIPDKNNDKEPKN
ncbi:hypothetical protein [Ornithinibacillus halophilus]|uniref:Uncharacterized protein n=1 Tax=Ornithinibacillus halophilus TaxID=930117 RepID=A0A1M5GXD2_9BACI|nr:hypothetical protein [Ornithinibacillus halophilus]SHG08381.1 hypothetical protein SAMN05216225_10156 [Ornithinibacillus halophilus]